MDGGGRGGEECKGQFHDFSGHFVIRNAPRLWLQHVSCVTVKSLEVNESWDSFSPGLALLPLPHSLLCL